MKTNDTFMQNIKPSKLISKPFRKRKFDDEKKRNLKFVNSNLSAASEFLETLVRFVDSGLAHDGLDGLGEHSPVVC